MDFKEKTRLKIALSQIKVEVKDVNKQNRFKNSIGIVACLLVMISGIVYAKDIEIFIKNIFNNSTMAIDVAIESGYVQENVSEYICDKEIGIKVTSLILDDLNLDVAFNFETKKENVKSIRFNDFIIKIDNDKVLYKSELEYTDNLDEIQLCKSISWTNEPIKIDNNIYLDSIIFGLRTTSNEIENLYFYINSLNIVYEDNSLETVDGNWEFEIKVNENMRKSKNKEYTLAEKNDYVKNCVGTLSPTGMIVELELYQVFDVVKFIEDNMDELEDTGLFYIKYKDELLLPSLVENSDTSGLKLKIYYNNIGAFFENIEEIELHLLPFDTTIKLTS